jgi:hypothetical protein
MPKTKATSILPLSFAASIAWATAGCSVVEYFDLPEFGMPLEDSVGWSVALADRIRALAGS